MPGSRPKVLIVEDEAIVACDLERRLRKAGYAVSAIAATGELALRSIEETFPDLVLMDIHLQGPSDGIVLASQVRDRFHLPVIFLTAFADKATLERAKATGPYGYLVKPVTHINLASTIDVVLHKHRAEQELRNREAWLATVLHS
jgi:CheY-like chemotaxis protein